MPSLEDFERDYWAPDRDQVLADMRAQQAPAQMPGWGLPGGAYDGRYNGGFTGYGPGGIGGGYQQPQAPDWGNIQNSWLTGGGRTLGDWQNFVQKNNLQQYVAGSKGDKLKLPDGRVIDAVYASGLGGQGAQWNVEGEGGGGGYPGGGFSSGAGSYGGYNVGQAPNPTPFEYEKFQRPEFQAPGAFSYEEFKAPTGLDYMNDPGYQERLKLGTDAIQRSAAARGTLLTGGTMKELGDYGQTFASNEYNNVYNRALQDYNTNRANEFQNYAMNYQNALGAYQTNYQNALDAYKTNFETQFKPWEANYQQAYNSWAGDLGAAHMRYTDDLAGYNSQFQNQLAAENSRFSNSLNAQNSRYNQLYGNASLGLQATGQQANAYGNYGNALAAMYGSYGNSMGDLLTGQGNANASGQVGSANAWNGAFGNMANMASMYGLYGGMMGQPATSGGVTTGGGSTGNGALAAGNPSVPGFNGWANPYNADYNWMGGMTGYRV